MTLCCASFVKVIDLVLKLRASTQKAPQTVVVRNLDNLISLNDDYLPEGFLESMDTIFSYNIGDIQGSLCDFSKESLGKLHKSLCEKVVAAFPQFKDRRPINRQVKKTLIHDITVLGYSLMNKSPLKDVDKIFHQTGPASSSFTDGDDTDTSQTSEIAELVLVVASLNSRLSKLEVEVTELRSKLAVSEQQQSPTPEETSDDSDSASDCCSDVVDTQALEAEGFTIHRK